MTANTGSPVRTFTDVYGVTREMNILTHSARGKARGRAPISPRHAAGAVVALLMGAMAATAQIRTEDLATASLEELLNITVTTASRSSESLADAPARMRVVTGDEIRRRGYRSLSDVLRDLPEFTVDIGTDPDYPSQITVQGTRGTNRVIVLLDGVRISSPTNEPLSIVANYPVHAAQQVEVVYGPASALYGADAFSSVINIISKTGVESPGFTAASSGGQFGLFNQTMSYRAKIGVDGSLLLAGQIHRDQQPDFSKYYPDYQGLEGHQTGTFNTIFGPMVARDPVSPRYENPLAAHSLQASFNLGGLSLSMFANESRASTSPAYTPDNAVYNADAFNKNHLIMTSGSYRREIGRVTSTSTLSFTRHELDPESGFRNVFSNMKRSYKYAYGSMLKGDQQFSWKLSPAISLATGGTVERFFAIPQTADLNEPLRSQDVPGTNLDTDIPDELVKLHYTNSGAYAQVQYAATPRLTVTLGARGDYNSRFGGTFNPRAGLVADLPARTTLKVLYGTAYLAPSPYQSYSHFGAFYSTDGGATYQSDFWHLPNPDLRPEKKQTLEVNVQKPIGRSLVASASTFYSHVTDLRREADPELAYSGTYLGWPVAYIQFPVNEGNETTWGGTAALEFVRSFGVDRRLAARAALGLADGQVSQQGNAGLHLPTGGMVPVQFKSGIDFDWGPWTVAPRLTSVGRQRFYAVETVGDSTIRRTLPGYTTVDVNVRRNVFDRLTAFVMVENALDARYRHINARAYTNPEELVGAPQNPRRLTGGFEIRLH